MTTVSLENVLLDVKELGRGMELIRRECSIHDNSVLRNFLSTNEGKLDKLQRDAKTAEVSAGWRRHAPLVGVVLVLGLENFRQAAGWLIWGQGLALWVAGRCLWRHALEGALGAPCSFPSHRGCGGHCCLSLVLAGPWWELGFPFPAGLTPSAHPFPRKPTTR